MNDEIVDENISKPSTISILKDWEKPLIEMLVNKLNVDGIISDEDDINISSWVIERWDNDCDIYLKQHGYKGGKLRDAGNFYEKHGAVYAIFDENIYTYESAQKYLSDHVKNNELPSQ